MMSNAEIFSESWRTFRSRWGVRLVAVSLPLAGLAAGVPMLLGAAFARSGIQTWNDFLALQQSVGYPLAVPSRTLWWQMTGATCFETLVRMLFGGLASLGCATVALRAARDMRDGWFGASLAGFARPLDVMWLATRMFVQVMLWSLLFVVPGVIAFYRYSQAWYLKAEHPDWGAGACLAASGRLMRGRKLALYGLHLRYLALMLAGYLGGTVLMPRLPAVACLSGVVALALPALVTLAFMAGMAAFYRELAACDAGEEAR